jgi:hypothetical protein
MDQRGGALALLKPVLGEHPAIVTIAGRANDAVIRTRAARLVIESAGEKARVQQDCELPSFFWWARGDADAALLQQNWVAGDFDTWVRPTLRCKAYGVRFLRSEITQIVPTDLSADPTPTPDSAKRGGRHPNKGLSRSRPR